METPQPPDRNLAMELIRVTEAAALAGRPLDGSRRQERRRRRRGRRHAPRAQHSIAMDGVVVIGEGEKDEAPMLYNGEQIGDGSDPKVDIAVDPLEGTTLTSLGPQRRDRRDRDRRAGHDVQPRARASTWRRSRPARPRPT